MALYSDNLRVERATNHNDSVPASAEFDAIRLNVENSTWPGGAGEPATPEDIDYLASAVTAAASLPVFASIGHHWEEEISWGNPAVQKEAYKHILDVTAGVDVQVVQDQVAIMESLSAQEIDYGSSIGKPVHVHVETYDVETHVDDMYEFNTFFYEGEAFMRYELSFWSLSEYAGFAFHFYRQSFGSPDILHWEWDWSFFADGFESGDTTRWSATVQ